MVPINKPYKYEPPNQKVVPSQKLYVNRPISSKVDQKIAAANHGMRKMPDVKPMGNQVRVNERLIKNNAANIKNYGGYNNAKYGPVKVAAYGGPRIANIKK